MDNLGWFIATAHNLLGHDKVAVVLGVDPGDKNACLICAYEHDPTFENKRAVEQALAYQTRPVPEGTETDMTDQEIRLRIARTSIPPKAPYEISQAQIDQERRRLELPPDGPL